MSSVMDVDTSTDCFEEYETSTRLKETISIRDILRDGAIFTKNYGEEKEISEELDMEQAYGYDELKPYCLFDNLDVGDIYEPGTPFACIREKMTNVTDDGKIMKQVLQIGSGDVAGEGVYAYYHYVSYCELCEIPFDVSYLRNKKPERSRIGISSYSLISGYDIALQTMKKGEISYFLIHPDYALGKLGCPPRVPPDSTILVKMELIDFCDYSVELEKKYKNVKTFSDILGTAQSFINMGNDQRRIGNNKAAIKFYKDALARLQNTESKNEEEERSLRNEEIRVYSNLAICYNDLKLHKKICKISEDAVKNIPELAASNAKLFFHWGKALRYLGDYTLASKKLKHAQRLLPNNSEIQEEIIILEEKMQNYAEIEKAACKNFLNLSVKEEDKRLKTNVSEEFIEIKNYLEEFIESSSTRIDLPGNLTMDELEVCKTLCKDMNLSFRDTTNQNMNSIVISKKQH